MALSMYQASVPVFVKTLGNLAAILDKAASFAAAKKVDQSVLLGYRLAPDMLNLARQVQIATDHAKGAPARLAGMEPPSFENTEASIAELKARIDKTIAFLGTLKPAQVDGSEEREVTLKMGGKTFYLQGAALPAALCAAEFLLSRHHRLRHSSPLRRGAGEERLHRAGLIQ